jgi:hypothetical protein
MPSDRMIKEYKSHLVFCLRRPADVYVKNNGWQQRADQVSTEISFFLEKNVQAGITLDWELDWFGGFQEVLCLGERWWRVSSWCLTFQVIFDELGPMRAAMKDDDNGLREFLLRLESILLSPINEIFWMVGTEPRRRNWTPRRRTQLYDAPPPGVYSTHRGVWTDADVLV